jgi:hypothetical protein
MQTRAFRALGLMVLTIIGISEAFAASQPDAVRVTNAPSDPVPVSGLVGVNGVVSVDTAPTNPVFTQHGKPFQQYVTVWNNNAGGEV